MIKNIFFPQKIGNNFFISQSFNVFLYDKKIVCISGKNEKNKIILNHFYQENFLVDSVEQTQLIADLLSKKTNENIFLIPDHIVLYRNIKLPITDKSTIRNIINFEIGPTLPFDINDSVYDFFIIPSPDKKNCTVWITFVFKETLKILLEPFEGENITVKSSLPCALDLTSMLNLKDTYLVCYQNGNVITILDFLNDELKDVFLVTAESFDLTLTNLLSSRNDSEKIYLIGELNVNSQFDFKKIEITNFKNVVVNFKNKNNIPLLLVGCAARKDYGYDFNLISTGQLIKENVYQLIVFFGFFIALLSFMIGHLILNNYRFNAIEKKSILEVKKELNKVGLNSKQNKLPGIIKDIEKEIKAQEGIWYAFSNQKRFSYLLTLSEITKTINKSATGLNIKKLTILPNSMLLEASVRDFASLQLLEEEINKSPYFRTMTPLQETSFNLTIKVLQDGAKA